MLKIAHYGGIQKVIGLLCREQSLAGHEAVALTGLEDQLSEYDIVHLHGAKALSVAREHFNKSSLARTHPHFVFTSFNDLGESDPSVSYDEDLMQRFAAIFSCDTFITSKLKSAKSYTWISQPVEQLTSLITKNYDNFVGPLEVSAAIRPQSKSQFSVLANTLEKLSTAGANIKFSEQKQLFTYPGDIFIDDFCSSAISYQALCALANGRTVLAKMGPQERSVNELLQCAPILDTDESNLEKRLAAICREPKSMRDISLRSINYIRANHNPKIVSDTLLEIYRQLI